MSRIRSLVISLGLLTALVLPACGSAAPPLSSSSGASDGPARSSGGERRAEAGPLPGPSSQPEGALRVGHYSTVHGREGFVLDLTGARPLISLDGSGRVVELTESPGPRDSLELRNDAADLWLRISEYHEVLFDGPNQHEGVLVVRDANAAPLR